MVKNRRDFLQGILAGGMALQGCSQRGPVVCRITGSGASGAVPARIRLTGSAGREAVPIGHRETLAEDAQEGGRQEGGRRVGLVRYTNLKRPVYDFCFSP